MIFIQEMQAKYRLTNSDLFVSSSMCQYGLSHMLKIHDYRSSSIIKFEFNPGQLLMAV